MDSVTNLLDPCWEESGEYALPPLDAISDRQSGALPDDPKNQASDIAWRVVHEVCLPVLEAPESELRQRVRTKRKKLADLLGAWRTLVADDSAPDHAAERISGRVETMLRTRFGEEAGLSAAMAFRSMAMAQSISHRLLESQPRDVDRDYVLSLRYVDGREAFEFAWLCLVTALDVSAPSYNLGYISGLASGGADACLAAVAEAESLREASEDEAPAPVEERTTYTLTPSGSATVRKPFS
ncbi:MAG: hypothetical protein KC668_01400 [Myxococcales bacterium]|nr:hypothetical protein [Myxococcales bacterium]